MANARLLEDNESYQLLLQERTLKGDFGRSIGSGGASDALAALEDAMARQAEELQMLRLFTNAPTRRKRTLMFCAK